jgi:hypothetical protein
MCACFDIEEMITEQKYLMELVMITVIVALIYNYLVGKEKNKTMVRSFVQNCLSTLCDNFYHIGLELQDTETLEHNYESVLSNENIVEEDSANFYRIYLTGRQNVKFCLTSISTKRRQDLLMSFFYALFFPEKDKVIIECALPEEWNEKGLLYIIRPKLTKKLLGEYEDLQSLCKKFAVNGMNDKQLAVFAEHNDTLESIMDKNIINELNSYGDCVDSIEMSDCVNNEIHKGNYIKMIVNVNKAKTEDFEKINKLINVFFALIDKIAKYNASAKTLEKFRENRKKFNSKKNQSKKDEEAQTMRLEKLKNMTASERKAYELKQEKRQKNRGFGKFKVMKKM